MKTTFKVGQRVRVLFANTPGTGSYCGGHQNAKWLLQKESVLKQHLRNCYYDATIRQVFEPSLITEEPRYLLDNTYHVMAFDEYKLGRF